MFKNLCSVSQNASNCVWWQWMPPPVLGIPPTLNSKIDKSPLYSSSSPSSSSWSSLSRSPSSWWGQEIFSILGCFEDVKILIILKRQKILKKFGCLKACWFKRLQKILLKKKGKSCEGGRQKYFCDRLHCKWGQRDVSVTSFFTFTPYFGSPIIFAQFCLHPHILDSVFFRII